jgi:hypothetical protein
VPEFFFDLADAGGFQLEGRVAFVADVVEAALGLARVEDVVGATLRAGNVEGRKRHRSSASPAWKRNVKPRQG